MPSHTTDTNLTFRAMTAADADSLCRMVRICYGDTYFAEEYCDPDAIRRLLRDGLLHSRIAVTSSGEVAAHLGMRLERADDLTADGSAAMVHPDYRGHSTLVRLGMELGEVYERLGLVGLHLYAVAVHGIVQGQTRAAGGIETGILVGHCPAGIQMAGFEHGYGESRIAADFLYFPLKAHPQRTVFLPEHYSEVVNAIYHEARLPRVLGDHTGHALPERSTISITTKPKWGLCVVRVQQPGSDLPEVLARIQAEHKAQQCPVTYVDLPLGDSGTPALTERLHSLGFFYGAILPERGGTDLLRLQCMERNTVNPDAIVLATDRGRQLLQFTMADMQDAADAADKERAE